MSFLSIFFVAIITLISAPILIYTIGYLKEYKHKYNVYYATSMTVLFIFSMIGVVVAQTSISFLILWEIMSMLSFFLVIYEYKKEENLKSGILYFIMTHISGLSLMIMFGLIYKYTGSFNFNEIQKNVIYLTQNQKIAIFLFSFIGFGAKAGIMPLHAWLPKAHPVAPSNISALMSGLMLKVAIYGFILVNFVFLDNIPYTCGILVMVIGSVTALVAIINSIVQKDIKKLLAYSSVENIGIIFATIGLAMIFTNIGMKEMAVFTLSAALFHCLSHAAFKSLAFSSAGAVLYATGTKNMDELGGLHKKMKFATVCAFIATAGMSAIPPLSGFASEVMIFESFVRGSYDVHNKGIMLLIIACGILLVMTSGGAIYSAVKSFGITYLSEPRTQKAENPHRLPISMNIGMLILSVYVVILGVISPFAIQWITVIANKVLKVNAVNKISFIGKDVVNITSIVIVVALLVWIIERIININKKIEVKGSWACGFQHFEPTMQYTGSGLSQPLTRIAGQFVNHSKKVSMKDKIFIRHRFLDVIEKYIYTPVYNGTQSIANLITKIHSGKIQLYILYIFATLVITMILASKI